MFSLVSANPSTLVQIIHNLNMRFVASNMNEYTSLMHLNLQKPPRVHRGPATFSGLSA